MLVLHSVRQSEKKRALAPRPQARQTDDQTGLRCAECMALAYYNNRANVSATTRSPIYCFGRPYARSCRRGLLHVNFLRQFSQSNIALWVFGVRLLYAGTGQA